MAYPPRVPDHRTEPMNVRVTAEERRVIERAARRRGMKPSVWIRTVALLHAPEPRPRQLPRWLPEK